MKTPKNIEIQNFEPKKMTRAYVCIQISEYPPPPPGEYTSFFYRWKDRHQVSGEA